MMIVELGRALPNSTLSNLSRVSTLIWLNNYVNPVNKLLDFNRTILKTSITIHYSLFQ
jgi:hypothetical protein